MSSGYAGWRFCILVGLLEGCNCGFVPAEYLLIPLYISTKNFPQAVTIAVVSICGAHLVKSALTVWVYFISEVSA